MGIEIFAGAAQLASQALNFLGQGNMNKKTRKWNEKMYNRQRADALADWQRQNEYNLPSNTMARLKAGGLNPNLIYDNGAGANMSAPIRSTDSGNWNPQAPEVDLGAVMSDGLSAYYDAQQKPIITNNLALQGEAVKKDIDLKNSQIDNTIAQTEATIANTNKTKFDLGVAEELRSNSLDYARGMTRKQEADIKYTLDQNERQELTNDMSLQEAAARITTMRLQNAKIPHEINNLKAQLDDIKGSVLLKKLDAELKAKGYQPTDPLYQRVLGELLKSGDLSPKTWNGTPFQSSDLENRIRNKFKKWLKWR